MKQSHNLPPVLLLIILSLSLAVTSCKKDEEEEETAGLTVTTKDASHIGRGWATLNGQIKTDKNTFTISFEYDKSTTYGHSVTGTPETVKGDTTKSIYANLPVLEPNTQYYFRLKAVSSGGTTYGSDMSFTTTALRSFNITFNPGLVYGSVTDIDGNIYKTITIGNQTWMAENLKVTKYNDGTIIPFNPVAAMWYSATSGGYSWYNSDSLGYGALYNWHAAGSDKLCPAGWHVPSDAEWSILVTYLGGESGAGAKLKESGTVHWSVPNSGATNEPGFSALPGGYRNSAGTFNSIKQKGYWWSASAASSTEAYYRSMGYNYGNIDKTSTNKVSGFSVRCVKDN